MPYVIFRMKLNDPKLHSVWKRKLRNYVKKERLFYFRWTSIPSTHIYIYSFIIFVLLLWLLHFNIRVWLCEAERSESDLWDVRSAYRLSAPLGFYTLILVQSLDWFGGAGAVWSILWGLNRQISISSHTDAQSDSKYIAQDIQAHKNVASFP